MKNLLCLSVAFLSLLLVNESFAQKIVKDLSISAEEATIEMADQKQLNYLVEIAGPNAYYWKQQVEETKSIRLSNQQANGETFPDGLYSLQVTPVYQLTAEQREILLQLRAQNDEAAIAAFRQENNLPENVEQFVVNFSIKNGKFVSPDNKEAKMEMPSHNTAWIQDHPSLYASVEPVVTNLPARLILDESNLSEDDQVFIDDVIVDGSICVGQDCVNGENFGFDTQRLKENNLRIHFDDTSSSGSFPSNDWRISINDSSNGGASYFAVEDATAGTTPFRVRAGAGNNALYISNSGGNVGMGTASPVVELHITDGDSPTMRLEQNGSNGWTPQTWDVAGNETNFFVRDVTNGSKLPFKIRPGAPDNSLYIDSEGDIGLGTANPGNNALQIESGDLYMKNGNLGIKTVPTVALDVLGSTKLTGDVAVTGGFTLNGNISSFSTGQSSFLSLNTFGTMLLLDGATGNVGIGTATTSHALQVGSDDVVKPTAGGWLGASDRRLKKDIKDYTDGLEKLMQIRPVTYRFNGKLGLPTDTENVGIIAQEMQEIAPYMIKHLNDQSEEGKGEDYLAYDGSALTYMLVNAVQEQQAIIESQKSEINTLQSELAELQELKAEVAALAELVKSQKNTNAAEEAVGEE